eukprot:5344053-Amphidinium_carterae.2
MALSCATLGIGLRRDVLLQGSALMVGRIIANGACCSTGQWIANSAPRVPKEVSPPPLVLASSEALPCFQPPGRVVN